MKIVERTGDTLVDLLHKSNSWANEDCERTECLVCSSSEYGSKKGSCRKRNITYETFCITCQKLEKKKDPADDNEIVDVEKEDIINRLPSIVFIDENGVDKEIFSPPEKEEMISIKINSKITTNHVIFQGWSSALFTI